MDAVDIDPDIRFGELQRQLRAARWPMGDGRPSRLIVVVTSINLDESVMARHAEQVAILEERGLWLLLALRRPWVRVAAVLRRPLPAEVLDYYLSLIPGAPGAAERLTVISLDDVSHRPLAEVLLDSPGALAQLRELVGDDPSTAFIQPFNVTTAERDVAVAINAPVYGVDHRCFRLGYKSTGRKLFREVGVSCARGVEDVRSPADIRAAIAALQPVTEVVVKLEDSVYGEGNFRLRADADPETLPPDYLADLERMGGAVEEWVTGEEVASPSVQLRILPEGEPLVISTHDQVLGGANGQQFAGCSFPARTAYHRQIVQDALRIAAKLAAEGVVGRFGVDFVVTRRPDGTWDHYAMELNLREGGTSHPYGTLWLLTEGNYDAGAGAFRIGDGNARAYVASDAVAVRASSARELLEHARAAGVGYDPATATGTVFHMFRAIEAEGRIAAVTIGRSQKDAAERHARLLRTVG